MKSKIEEDAELLELFQLSASKTMAWKEAVQAELKAHSEMLDAQIKFTNAFNEAAGMSLIGKFNSDTPEKKEEEHGDSPKVKN